jgi:hypothetical protein
MKFCIAELYSSSVGIESGSSSSSDSGDLVLDLTGDKLIAFAFPFALEDWLDSLKAFDLESVAVLAFALA